MSFDCACHFEGMVNEREAWSLKSAEDAFLLIKISELATPIDTLPPHFGVGPGLYVSIGEGEIVGANCAVECVSAGDRVRNAGLAIPSRTESVGRDGLRCSRGIVGLLRPRIGVSRSYQGRVGELRRAEALQGTRYPPEHIEASHRPTLITVVSDQVCGAADLAIAIFHRKNSFAWVHRRRVGQNHMRGVTP
jgi:hypothetical protein